MSDLELLTDDEIERMCALYTSAPLKRRPIDTELERKGWVCKHDGGDQTEPSPAAYDIHSTHDTQPPKPVLYQDDGTVAPRWRCVRARAEFNVDVPREHWIDFLTQYCDTFKQGYSGYWAHGISCKGGWLVYEQGDDAQPSDAEVKVAKRAHRAGTKLPDRWFLLDEAAAIRAYVEGVKRWGIGWFEGADANGYDIVIQLALLGEVKYG